VPAAVVAHNHGVESAPPLSYWLAASPRPAAARAPSLRGDAVADVAIVGAGHTGLWTAIRLLETDPGLRVRVLEMEHVGFGASGRNGGFCEASLTHGLENGLRHFPDEMDVLLREGQANLRELVAFLGSHDIACHLEETGLLHLTDRPDDVDEFRAHAELANGHGERTIFLDGPAARSEVHSPRWTAGLWKPDAGVMLDPVKLAQGLARVAVEMGAVLHEETRVTGIERVAGGVRLGTVAADGAPGSVRASQAVVATSAYSGWLRRLLPLFVPVYDYALVSEPLTPEQRAAIGWARRQGLSDAYNQFHYFRLTADDRVLWGGGDAIYHPGNGVGPTFDRRPATFERLEADFRATFPQLAGLRFPFRWGGAIDTTTRFTVTFGRTIGDRVVYALGYTGLGVGAARWAAGIVRDMLLRPDSELLRLRFVRTKPFPFPPEPLRSLVVEAVHNELVRADAGGGRRGPLLRALDALGIGFDS
jgi:glycine/D-amino acid oxidase-like deaminating enzyme